MKTRSIEPPLIRICLQKKEMKYKTNLTMLRKLGKICSFRNENHHQCSELTTEHRQIWKVSTLLGEVQKNQITIHLYFRRKNEEIRKTQIYSNNLSSFRIVHKWFKIWIKTFKKKRKTRNQYHVTILRQNMPENCLINSPIASKCNKRCQKRQMRQLFARVRGKGRKLPEHTMEADPISKIKIYHLRFSVRNLKKSHFSTKTKRYICKTKKSSQKI